MSGKELQKAPQPSANAVLMENFKGEVQKVIPYLKTLLGNDDMVDRFVKMTHLALMRDPKLLQADVKSLLMALIWAAYRDLEPGVEDGVWLIPYKVKGVLTVTPVPGYKGLIKRATDTESVARVNSYPIYQGDKVVVKYGLDEDLIHEPSFGDQRGALIGAAVVFVMPDGSKRFHVMYRQDIEKIRNSSAAWKAAPGTGPWADWEEAMFRKTVIKQGFKEIPVKSQLRDLIRDDNRLEVGATVESLLAETGQELPDNLGGGVSADQAPAKEETLDTSAFDKQVEEKFAGIKEADEYKAKYQALQNFLQVTANGQKKKMTVPALKVMAGAPNMFPSFWDAFEKYLSKQQTPPPAEPPAETPLAAPAETQPAHPETAGTTVITPQVQGTMFNGGEADHFAGPGDQDPDFLKCREAVWNQIVEKMIPIEVLKEVGVSELTSITADNLSQIEELVQGYQPAKKGRK